MTSPRRETHSVSPIDKCASDQLTSAVAGSSGESAKSLGQTGNDSTCSTFDNVARWTLAPANSTASKTATGVSVPPLATCHNTSRNVVFALSQANL